MMNIKLANTRPEAPVIVEPEPWLTDKPCRVSEETALWVAALAFVEVVLEFDIESRYTFLEIVRQWEKKGCQQVIDEALIERFNSYECAERFIQNQKRHKSIHPLTAFSAKLQQYQTEIDNGTFDNRDYLGLINLIGDFTKMHCNCLSDYENDTCKITIDKSPRLYSILIIKSLYMHLNRSPISIDKRRFGALFDVIYGNPKPNQDKIAKSKVLEHYKRLELALHNDSYFIRKAELFYRAKVNHPANLSSLGTGDLGIWGREYCS